MIIESQISNSKKVNIQLQKADENTKFVQEIIKKIAKVEQRPYKDVLEEFKNQKYEFLKNNPGDDELSKQENQNIIESFLFDKIGKINDQLNQNFKIPTFDETIFQYLFNAILAKNKIFLKIKDIYTGKPFVLKTFIYPSKFIKLPDWMSQIDTAAASSKGEIIFNKNFAQQLINYAFLKNEKGKSGFYKSNGGKIPDSYIYIEFLILHELYHIIHGDHFHPLALTSLIMKKGPQKWPNLLKASGWDGKNLNILKQIAEQLSHRVQNIVGDAITNYQLVKAGYPQLPIGIFYNNLNFDHYNSMQAIQEAALDYLEKNASKTQQDPTKQMMNNLTDDHLDSNDQKIDNQTIDDGRAYKNDENQKQNQQKQNQQKQNQQKQNQKQGKGNNIVDGGGTQGKNNKQGKDNKKQGPQGKNNKQGKDNKKQGPQGQGGGLQGPQGPDGGLQGPDKESGEGPQGPDKGPGDEGQVNGQNQRGQGPGQPGSDGNGQGQPGLDGNGQGGNGQGGNGQNNQDNKLPSEKEIEDKMKQTFEETDKKLQSAQDNLNPEEIDQKIKEIKQAEAQWQQNLSAKERRDLLEKERQAREQRMKQLSQTSEFQPINWKKLIKKMIPKPIEFEDESFAKMHRRTRAQLALNKNKISVKPGQKKGEIPFQDLLFILDVSGSMYKRIDSIALDLLKLISQADVVGIKNMFFIMFDTKWDIYKLNLENKKNITYQPFLDPNDLFKKNVNLDKIKLKGKPKPIKQLFQISWGGGTNIPVEILKVIELFQKKGDNQVIFSDSDLLWENNLPKLKKACIIGKKRPYSFNIIFDSRSTFIKASANLGRYKYMSYLEKK